MYPNPTKGLLTLELNGIVSELNIQILSVNGSILISKTYISSTIDVINLSSLNNGIYLLKIYYNDMIETKGIILNK